MMLLAIYQCHLCNVCAYLNDWHTPPTPDVLWFCKATLFGVLLQISIPNIFTSVYRRDVIQHTILVYVLVIV